MFHLCRENVAAICPIVADRIYVVMEKLWIQHMFVTRMFGDLIEMLNKI